jgi:hypothetical protein
MPWRTLNIHPSPSLGLVVLFGVVMFVWLASISGLTGWMSVKIMFTIVGLFIELPLVYTTTPWKYAVFHWAHQHRDIARATQQQHLHCGQMGMLPNHPENLHLLEWEEEAAVLIPHVHGHWFLF